VMSTTRTRW